MKMFYKTFRNHKNCEDSGWQYRQHLHNVKVLWLRNSKHSFTVLEQLSEVTNMLPLEVIESHHKYNVHKMCLVPINTSWLSIKHDVESFWFSVRHLEYWIFRKSIVRDLPSLCSTQTTFQKELFHWTFYF